MRKKVMVYIVALVLLLAAPVAIAAPMDGFGWLAWWSGAWDAVLDVFASSSEEEEPEPAPAPVPPAKGDEPATTNGSECPTCGGGDTDAGPGLDPNG